MCIATGCTQDANTQHLHDETKFLSMNTQLTLHATQLKQLTQTQTHPLHDLNAYLNWLRNIEATILHNNEHTNIIISEPDITPEECRESLKHIHTTITSQYLSFRKNNKVTNTTPYDILSSKQTLPHHMHTKLGQLKANKLPFFKVTLKETDMPQCPLWLLHTHSTNHLFNFSQLPTQHTTTILWKKPLETAEVIQEWESRLASLRG